MNGWSAIALFEALIFVILCPYAYYLGRHNGELEEKQAQLERVRKAAEDETRRNRDEWVTDCLYDLVGRVKRLETAKSEGR